MSRAPFRADHVGSLLRPERLRQARRARAPDLRAIEDQCIREVVRMQEDLGLQSITDGEFRRGFYHIDFLSRLEGVTFEGVAQHVRYRGERRQHEFDVPKPAVTGRLARGSSLAEEEMKFLKGVTTRTAKVCIPAPSMLQFGGIRVDEKAYPDRAEFFAGLVEVYREELAALYAAGCRYVQIDDPYLGFLCDPARRADGDAALYASLIERIIRGRPADLAVTVHICRGNFSRTGVASGGYEPVAEAVCGIGADGFFLEFDDERSGGFEPLRFMPRGTKVVLGLVSTKRPGLEPGDALRRRIDQAAKIVPLEDLCISPQCGFSSTEHGTDLTEAEQAAKLALIVELAARIWGPER